MTKTLIFCKNYIDMGILLLRIGIGMAFMKIPAEYSAIYGGDECDAGARGMQSPSTKFKKPRLFKAGSFTIYGYFKLFIGELVALAKGFSATMRSIQQLGIARTFCFFVVLVGAHTGVHAATSFQEEIITESSAVLGSDYATPESVTHTSTVSNTDGSSGTFTVTATTTGGQLPKASVGGTLTNLLPLSAGGLRNLHARVFYDVGIFPVLTSLPANLLVPLVVNAAGSASVSVTDPTKAFFGVSGSLLLTLPNSQGGPSGNMNYVEGASASINCSGGFNFCTMSNYLEGYADSFQYNGTFFYAPGSIVTVELTAFIAFSPLITDGESISFQAMADPNIFIDPEATFVNTLGETIRFADAFELSFSSGILPGVPTKSPTKSFIPSILPLLLGE